MSHNIDDAQNQANRGISSQIKMETTHYGIRLTMPVSPDEDSLLELLARIPSDAYHLPKGESIAFDFQGRACSPTLLVRLLREVVWDKQLRVAAWLSHSEESLRLFQSAGLVVTEPSAQPDGPSEGAQAQQAQEERAEGKQAEDEGFDGKGAGLPDPGESDVPVQPDVLNETDELDGLNRFDERLDEEYADDGEETGRLDVVCSSLRSGQHIESPGDVILWGHLNSGAEITAGGSVVVAGRLHGLVHAGCDGRKDIFIQAGAFEATQVRLGRKIGYADETTPGWGKPVLITVEEDGALAIRENNFFKASPEPGAWTPAPESN